MKKILFFALMLFAGMSLNAQSADTAKKQCTAAEKAACAKTCSKAKATKVASASFSREEAIAAAEKDESIEHKVCAESGTVSFTKKSVCPMSGKVSYSQVNYDGDSKTFVNVSPSEMYKDKKEVSTVKASSMEKAAAVKVDGKAKKSCTAAEKAACAKTCSSKKAKKENK